MISIFQDFLSYLGNHLIQVVNKNLNKVIQKYEYLFFIKNYPNNISLSKINEMRQDSSPKIIIISEYIEDQRKMKIGTDLFILCFENMLIIIEQSEIHQFSQFFSNNQKSLIYVFSDTIHNKIKQALDLDICISIIEKKICQEINSMAQQFEIEFKNHTMPKNITQIIRFCKIIVTKSISSYLILKSYNKIKNFDRVLISGFYDQKPEDITIEEDDYLVLGKLVNVHKNNINLIYHIEKEELYIMKIYSNEKVILFEREHQNYLNISHPFFPRYIGIAEYYSYKTIVIEYIQGKSIDLVKEMKLSKTSKIKIIFQILVAFEYLHHNGYIYRDLKPDCIFVINENYSISIIDFDRMILNIDNYVFTQDFDHEFIAPEIIKGEHFSCKADIYSVGKLILYLFEDEFSNNEYFSLKKMCEQCINENEIKRPNISQLIEYFYANYYSKEFIKIDENDIFKFRNHLNLIFNSFLFFVSEFQHFYSQFKLGLIHFLGFEKYNYFLNEDPKLLKIFRISLIKNDIEDQKMFDSFRKLADINKVIYYLTLSADQDYSLSQYLLGFIYYVGNYIKKDINKSIHYLTLASNQNKLAQYSLGLIYYSGNGITQDINKAIHYFTLAANQNHLPSQLVLALFYFLGQYRKQDINKAIYYFTLAANQKSPIAQYYLGLIYYENKYIEQDINKALFYLKHAADQNDEIGQFCLGLVHYEGNYIKQDIYKAIYYLTLSANQNNSFAQYYLGLIYYENKYIEQDINKAIFYFKLAADQNIGDAQLYLGLIYYQGNEIMQDINQSIHYFTLASKQNNSKAQYYLGKIYYEGKYVKQDVNKAINYFFTSVENNNPNSQIEIAKFYLFGQNIKKNINKAIYYFNLAASNDLYEANFYLGCIYFKGEGVVRNINKSIKYFKELSSFNHSLSKNNLGMIYKNIIKNGVAIEYFEEAIHQKNDIVAMYNLGHIYYLGDFIERDFDKSISYLLKSFNFGFDPSKFVLSLAVFSKVKSFYYEVILSEIKKHGNIDDDKFWDIFDIIIHFKNKNIYRNLNICIKEIEFVYDYTLSPVLYKEYMKENNVSIIDDEYDKKYIITKDFYDGFLQD